MQWKHKALILGAGKIARGFVAHLAIKSGFHVTFAEKDPKLVYLLKQRCEYRLHFFNHPEKDETIRGFDAVGIEDRETLNPMFRDADVAFTAVGGKNLESLGLPIAVGIEARKNANGRPLNIVLCENWHSPAAVLRETVRKHLTSDSSRDFFEENVGLLESTVFRSCVEPPDHIAAIDPLAVMVQDYWTLQVDGDGVKGAFPPIQGVQLIENFANALERKLFIYNAASATVSYLGYLKGYHYLAEACKDPEIRTVLSQVYEESGRALMLKHGYTKEDQDSFAAASLSKLQNEAIQDTLERNARDPIRKLGPRDRLVGPACAALEYGISPKGLATVIAAAIRYDQPGDPSAKRLQQILAQDGLDGVLSQVCRVDPDGPLGKLVKEKWEFLSETITFSGGVEG